MAAMDDPNYNWVVELIEKNCVGVDYGEGGGYEYTDVYAIADALIYEMKQRGLIP